MRLYTRWRSIGLALAIFLLNTTGLVAQEQLMHVKDFDGTDLYIDKDGKRVFSGTFIEAMDFSEGLVRVKSSDKEKKWEFRDEKGNVVINPLSIGEYYDLVDSRSTTDTLLVNILGDFHDGLARVEFSKYSVPVNAKGKKGSPQATDKALGFINKKGELAIDATPYRSVGDFHDGLARVRDNNSNWGFMNTTGEIVIPFKKWDVWDFSNGLARVQYSTSRKFGFIDKSGTNVIRPNFDFANDFHDDVAVVGDFDTGQLGYIDKTGTIVETLKSLLNRLQGAKYELPKTSGGDSIINIRILDSYAGVRSYVLNVAGRWDNYYVLFLEKDGKIIKDLLGPKLSGSGGSLYEYAIGRTTKGFWTNAEPLDTQYWLFTYLDGRLVNTPGIAPIISVNSKQLMKSEWDPSVDGLLYISNNGLFYTSTQCGSDFVGGLAKVYTKGKRLAVVNQDFDVVFTQ